MYSVKVLKINLRKKYFYCFRDEELKIISDEMLTHFCDNFEDNLLTYFNTVKILCSGTINSNSILNLNKDLLDKFRELVLKLLNNNKYHSKFNIEEYDEFTNHESNFYNSMNVLNINDNIDYYYYCISLPVDSNFNESLVTNKTGIKLNKFASEFVIKPMFNNVTKRFLSSVNLYNNNLIEKFNSYCIKSLGEGEKIVKSNKEELFNQIKSNLKYLLLNSMTIIKELVLNNNINDLLKALLNNKQSLIKNKKILESIESNLFDIFNFNSIEFNKDIVVDYAKLKQMYIEFSSLPFDYNIILSFLVNNSIISLQPEEPNKNPEEPFKLIKVDFNNDVNVKFEDKITFIGKLKDTRSTIVFNYNGIDHLINIESRHINDIIKFYSSILKDDKLEAKPLIIDNNKYLNFQGGLDLWQEEFVNAIDENKSIILVGDTSGGKTAISLYAIRKFFFQYSENSKDITIVYIAPTDALANQQYFNMIKQFERYKNKISICTESLVYINENSVMLIGTPHEVKNYLISSKNINNKILDSNKIIENCFVNGNNKSIIKPKIIFIDEAQTMSLKYAQDDRDEQKVNAKSIETIISTLDVGGQVICMSATLSDKSIENLKNKLNVLSGIKDKDLKVIKYTFSDIGFKRGDNRSTFQPIMKRQEKFPINFTNGIIEKYNDGDKFTKSNLDDTLIDTLIRKVKKDGNLPLALFCGNELDTIYRFRLFINYLDSESNKCIIWNRIKRDYNISLQNVGTETITKLESQQRWIDEIISEINELKKIRNIESIKYQECKSLVDSYNNYIIIKGLDKSNSLSQDVIITPEIYGLLYEFNEIINYKLGFISNVHPYYNFSNNNNTLDSKYELKTPDGNKTIFNELLINQDCSTDENFLNIIDLILKGFKYGVSVLTQSIPFAFQAKIFEILNVNLNNTGSNSYLPILFCDYGISAGINISFLSCAILLREETNLNVNIFKQINGRSGRRGVKSNVTPMTYLFNVSNFSELNVMEDLEFNDEFNDDFIDNSNLYEFFRNMLIKYRENEEDIKSKESTQSLSKLFENDGKLYGVRDVHLYKFKVREMFDKLRYIFPEYCENDLRNLFKYLQYCEYNLLNTESV